MTDAVMTAPERVSTLDTQSDSLRAIGLKRLARSQQEILDVVLSSCEPLMGDMSLVEIQDAYERINGRRIDVGRVSARVSNLIAAGRLDRREATRPCSKTGRPVHPVFPPQKQARLLA